MNRVVALAPHAPWMLAMLAALTLLLSGSRAGRAVWAILGLTAAALAVAALAWFAFPWPDRPGLFTAAVVLLPLLLTTGGATMAADRAGALSRAASAAGLLLAALATTPWLAAIGIAAAVLALYDGRSHPARATADFWLLAGAGTSVFGLVLLQAAAGPGHDHAPHTWVSLAADPFPSDPSRLRLAIALSLLGLAGIALGAVHQARRDLRLGRVAGARGIASLMLLPVALLLALRLTATARASELPALPALFLLLPLAGLLALAARMLRGTDGRHHMGHAVAAQFCLLLVALTLGARGAATALTLSLVLATSAALVCHAAAPGSATSAPPALRAGLTLAGLALAGMPPFAGFAGSLALLDAAWQVHPWLALPLFLGMGLTGWSLLRGIETRILSAPSAVDARAPRAAGILPAWLLLAANALAGCTLPWLAQPWPTGLPPPITP
jgi:hypothetical protein